MSNKCSIFLYEISLIGLVSRNKWNILKMFLRCSLFRFIFWMAIKNIVMIYQRLKIKIHTLKKNKFMWRTFDACNPLTKKMLQVPYNYRRIWTMIFYCTFDTKEFKENIKHTDLSYKNKGDEKFFLTLCRENCRVLFWCKYIVRNINLLFRLY